MSTLLSSDSFNRANGALGSTNGTGVLDPVPWALHGTWAINTNQAQSSVVSLPANATIDLLVSDFDISLDVATLDGSPGIIFRKSDENNYFVLRRGIGGSNFELVRVQGGVATQLMSYATAATGTWRISASGSILNGYLNGTLRVFANDAFNVNITVAGLYIYNSTLARLDNWTVSSVREFKVAMNDTVYWTPKTTIESTTMSQITPVYDTDVLWQGVFNLASFNTNLVNDSGDSDPAPTTVLSLGSQNTPFQYNGNFWKISILLNDENTKLNPIYEIFINGQRKVGTLVNYGQCTLEYIIDPVDAATWDTPLLPGDTVTVSWEWETVDSTTSSGASTTKSTSLRADTEAADILYIEDLGIPHSEPTLPGGIPVGSGGGTGGTSSGPFIILENGSGNLLMETGDFLLLES